MNNVLAIISIIMNTVLLVLSIKMTVRHFNISVTRMFFLMKIYKQGFRHEKWQKKKNGNVTSPDPIGFMKMF